MQINIDSLCPREIALLGGIVAKAKDELLSEGDTNRNRRLILTLSAILDECHRNVTIDDMPEIFAEQIRYGIERSRRYENRR